MKLTASRPGILATDAALLGREGVQGNTASHTHRRLLLEEPLRVMAEEGMSLPGQHSLASPRRHSHHHTAPASGSSSTAAHGKACTKHDPGRRLPQLCRGPKLRLFTFSLASRSARLGWACLAFVHHHQQVTLAMRPASYGSHQTHTHTFHSLLSHTEHYQSNKMVKSTFLITAFPQA